jgi:hypothetical protein
VRFDNVRSSAMYLVVCASLLAAGCGANQLDDAPPEGATVAGQAATGSTQPRGSSALARQVTIEGYTYSISPGKVLRAVDNLPPGYVLPHPSFQIALVNPVDRGAKLFTDFNAHFRIAYRRTLLDDVLNYDGATFDTSSCQNVPALPGFCVVGLLAEPGSRIVQRNIYESILTDESGNNIQDPYAWITVNKPIFIQFPGDQHRFVVRDGYESSDFALVYMDLSEGNDSTIDTLVFVQD